jgi:putative FmdB family regulatory protein
VPIYDYFCADCDGVFELLRPVRDAGDTHPCPLCDLESPRVMSYAFSAFTVRQGNPRRLPDRMKFTHLGKEVDSPVTGSSAVNEHPELNRPAPPKPLSVEEIEQFEHTTETVSQQGREQMETFGARVQGPGGGREDPFQFTRRLKARGTQREESAKRRMLKRYSK